MRKIFMSNRGSFTVEASIIFPIIFLCIISIIYISLLLYQMVLVQAVADRTIERGTSTWSNPEKEISSGAVSKADLDSGGLYWRLYDKYKDRKGERLDTYLKNQMGRFDVLKGTYTVSDPVVSNYIIYKKLAVEVESNYKLPIGKLLSKFGLSDSISIKTHSEAVINEPVEFIRNTDFLIDVEQEAEQSNDMASKAGKSVRGFVQKIMDTLTEIFNKS